MTDIKWSKDRDGDLFCSLPGATAFIIKATSSKNHPSWLWRVCKANEATERGSCWFLRTAKSSAEAAIRRAIGDAS